jgi:precorrin-3B C17-methyltransferase
MKQLYIIGTGPGGLEHLSPAARSAIAISSDLVGHSLYLALLGELTAGKRCHKLPMGQEIARAQLGLQLAAEGRTTALLSSGDAGIYAMATVVFELLDSQPEPAWSTVDIEVVPGISAMQAAAARVGAPLAHDFCAISLSDLLTPWEIIEQRIRAAAVGDFVVVFYNAVSKRRSWQLLKAKEILLQHREPKTPAVVALNVSREGEEITLTCLEDLNPDAMNMLTLVLVGNHETRRTGRWIYTPRGYSKKRWVLQETVTK